MSFYNVRRSVVDIVEALDERDAVKILAARLAAADFEVYEANDDLDTFEVFGCEGSGTWQR